MIGNKFMRSLFEEKDRDFAISELLEYLKFVDDTFINKIKIVELENITEEERQFLTITSALIDFFLQKNDLEIPEWIRDSKLVFDEPHFYQQRIEDIDKIKLMINNPAPFRNRNIFFDLDSIKRV